MLAELLEKPSVPFDMSHLPKCRCRVKNYGKGGGYRQCSRVCKYVLETRCEDCIVDEMLRREKFLQKEGVADHWR